MLLFLAVGGFSVSDLAKTFKLLDSASGTCKLLTPQQRFKKRAFSISETEFSARHLVVRASGPLGHGLHAIITLYLEEESIVGEACAPHISVRRFMRSTGLISNDLFMRALEVALRVIPRIRDGKKRISEEKALADLWLAMDEIQARVTYEQQELDLEGGQQSLDLDSTLDEDE